MLGNWLEMTLANCKHDVRSLLALVAAVGLVLQVLVASSAAAAMPHGPVLDAFGNPLCLAMDGREGVPSLPVHGGLQDCCSLGCGPSASPVGMPPEGAAELTAPPQVGRPVDAARLRSAIAKSGYEPGNPRAPPAEA